MTVKHITHAIQFTTHWLVLRSWKEQKCRLMVIIKGISLKSLGIESKLCLKAMMKSTLFKVNLFETHIRPISYAIFTIPSGRLTKNDLISMVLEMNKVA